MERIPLSRPSITDDEMKRLSDVLASGRLAMGKQIEEFESRMAAAAGTDFAVAVNSGTAALHLILNAAGITPGSEVITTPFSFVASSNVILYCGATPVFVDIDPETMNIDPDQITSAITSKTAGILAVDVFGVPADWKTLTRIAEDNGLILVDDACEALGAAVDGRPIGSFGLGAAFGFYPNKQITTGEGGCVTTNSETLAAQIRSLRNHGRATDDAMNHVRLGYNYRLSELSAAVGNAQLERLDTLLADRKHAAGLYNALLEPLSDDLVTPGESDDATRSWFVYVIQLSSKFGAPERDTVMHALRAAGIECAPYFPSIHLQPYYTERFGYTPGMYPVAESASDRCLALPFFPELSESQIRRVAAVIETELASLTPVRISVPAESNQ